jgi:hypothetical protein
MPGGPLVNLTSANERVPNVERRIRVVKERARATQPGHPFARIPKLLTIKTVLCCVKLLNLFPPKGGISDVLSPKTAMSGNALDCKRHLSLQIGQCCQVHEEEAPRNSQIARTKGAIALSPSGKIQGGFKFMALNTGKKIVQRNWDVTPMPDAIVARVNELGKDQPEQLIFTNRHGRPIRDVETPGVDVDVANDAQFPGVDPVIPGDIEIPGVDVESEAPQTRKRLRSMILPSQLPIRLPSRQPQQQRQPCKRQHRSKNQRSHQRSVAAREPGLRQNLSTHPA